MPDAYVPKIISMAHVPSFGPGGQPRTVTRVQLMVGTYGPFFHDFSKGSDSSEDINSWIQQQVNALRVLPTGE